MGSLFDKHLEYWAGAANGNGINKASNDNAQLEWFARIGANALGKPPYTEIPGLTKEEVGLTFGLNASYTDIEQTSSTLDPKSGAVTTQKLGSSPTTKLGVDAWSHYGPLSFQVEAYSRTVQIRRPAEALARSRGRLRPGGALRHRSPASSPSVEIVDADATHPGTLDRRVDVGLNYYVHANNLKVMARYGWLTDRALYALRQGDVQHGHAPGAALVLIRGSR